MPGLSCLLTPLESTPLLPGVPPPHHSPSQFMIYCFGFSSFKMALLLETHCILVGYDLLQQIFVMWFFCNMFPITMAIFQIKLACLLQICLPTVRTCLILSIIEFSIMLRPLPCLWCPHFSVTVLERCCYLMRISLGIVMFLNR